MKCFKDLRIYLSFYLKIDEKILYLTVYKQYNFEFLIIFLLIILLLNQ